MTRLRSRFAPLIAGMAVLAFVVPACNDEQPADEPSTTAAPGDDPSKPVTIEHRYGSTEIDGVPQRIVSLDLQWTDVLAALGAPPVGYIFDPNGVDGSFPWRDDLLGDATAITATDTLPYEQIAALQPDLIVVAYFATNESDYEKLSAIAPTIATLSDSQVDTWQDITTAAGKVLRDEVDAQNLIAEVDDEVADTAAELPQLQGKTFALVNYVAGDGFYVVSDPNDGASVLFDQLGMSISPTILEAGEGEESRVKLSLEQTSLLDADVLVLLTNGADPESIPGYSGLPAVKSGAVALLDYVDVTGLNTPTPLSVTYSLAEIRPALEAAAAA